jgi:hypothetical protein
MARTTVRGGQVTDGSVGRADLDVSSVGNSVVTKIIAGTGVSISETGADSGTGDVTINVSAGITGAGTSGKLTKYTGSTTIGNSLLSESGSVITGTAVNLSITGPSIASVGSGSGTAAVAVMALIGSDGGATSTNTGTVSGGAGGSFTFTGGVGGAITGTPTSGSGGAGGDMTFIAGDGGVGTTFGGRGGRIEFTAGGAGNGTGVGQPGYVKIAAGAGATTGNNDGGHVYLVGGAKNGSGNDGNILAGISPSATIRGNLGVATLTPAARVSINGGLHVGGDADPGDNNAAIDGTLVIGNATATALLHVETVNPAVSEAFRLNIPQSTTTFASTFGGITIANTDSTANNYARLNFGGETGTAATVTLATRITDHANRLGDFTIWNRTGAGTFTERFTILNSTGLVGIQTAAPTAFLHLPAGVATASAGAPLKFTSGTKLTTAEAGAVEYDGTQFYATIDTSSGRAGVWADQYFHLTTAGSNISTIGNFFGSTSNISLVASAYYIIDIYLWYTKNTAGTVTWTLTNSVAPTSQNIYYEMSPVTGMVAPPGTATLLNGQIYNDATAAKTIATASISNNAVMFTYMRIFLQNSTGTSLKIQATCSAGTITPGINSYWFCRRVAAGNVGTFAA